MIRDALDTYAATLDRKFNHDRSQTVGASEIGNCERRTHYAKKYFPIDEGFVARYGAHLRGTLMEKHFWYPALRGKYGDKLLYAGDWQKTFTAGHLSATPDGLVCDLDSDALREYGIKDIGSDCILVESKSLDPRVNLMKEREGHKYQVSVQLGLVRETTDFKPNYALITYMDASFWDEVDEFVVKFDETIYNNAKVRAKRILTADSPESLKPEGWIAGGDECRHCPWEKRCGRARRELPKDDKPADPQFVAEMTEMCLETMRAETAVESAEAVVKTKRNEIKNRLREKGVRRIPGLVTWSAIKAKTYWNVDELLLAATAAGIDVDQFSRTGEPTDRLQLFPPGGRRGGQR